MLFPWKRGGRLALNLQPGSFHGFYWLTSNRVQAEAPHLSLNAVTSTTSATDEMTLCFVLILATLFARRLSHFHPSTAAACCVVFKFDFFGRLCCFVALSERWFSVGGLRPVRLQPSRWNSCLNTLSERGCVSENHSWTNERRLPAYTVPLVYYWSRSLIGGKVGKIGLYVVFECIGKNGKFDVLHWKFC